MCDNEPEIPESLKIQTVDAVPEGLQLDLVTVIARIEQLEAEPYFDNGHFIWRRIVSCDLPRLRGHLMPAAIALLEREQELAGRPDPA